METPCNPTSLAEYLALGRRRVDYLLIWGHGLAHEEEILEMVEETPFQILDVLRHRPRSVRDLVRTVYSVDHANSHFLRAKTSFLLATPCEVVFVFFSNSEPEELLRGQGGYRHVECARVKALKTRICKRFNPRRADGEGPSKEDVVDTSDTGARTHDILHWLGEMRRLDGPKHRSFPFFPVPHFLSNITEVTIRPVPLRGLGCKVVCGSRWDFRAVPAAIEDSPHFRALATGNPAIYGDYARTFRGTALRGPCSERRFLALAEELNYLCPPWETSYVLVREAKAGAGLRVVDGLHRAAILRHRGYETMLAAILR